MGSKEKPVILEEPIMFDEEEEDKDFNIQEPESLPKFPVVKKQRKSPLSAKKLKVSKVTWGQVPHPGASVDSPPIRGRNPGHVITLDLSEDSPQPTTAPKKRGRKPKPKVEGEKIPKKRGRKPKAVATPGTSLESLKTSKIPLSERDPELGVVAKRPRKGRPKKLANEGIAKSQELNIQVDKDEKPADAIKLDKEEKEDNPVAKSLVKLSSEAEKTKDNIFDFEDDENKSPVEGSSGTSYKDMNSSESEAKKDD